MKNKVIKRIQKAANKTISNGKQKLHQIDRKAASKKAHHQKLSRKQKAVVILQKGIKDLSSYEDRQGIVGDVTKSVTADINEIIDASHGDNETAVLLDLCNELKEKTSEENQRHSTSEEVQTKKMENSELKKVYKTTNEICTSFYEILG